MILHYHANYQGGGGVVGKSRSLGCLVIGCCFVLSVSHWLLSWVAQSGLSGSSQLALLLLIGCIPYNLSMGSDWTQFDAIFLIGCNIYKGLSLDAQSVIGVLIGCTIRSIGSHWVHNLVQRFSLAGTICFRIPILRLLVTIFCIARVLDKQF